MKTARCADFFTEWSGEPQCRSVQTSETTIKYSGFGLPIFIAKVVTLLNCGCQHRLFEKLNINRRVNIDIGIHILILHLHKMFTMAIWAGQLKKSLPLQLFETNQHAANRILTPKKKSKKAKSVNGSITSWSWRLTMYEHISWKVGPNPVLSPPLPFPDKLGTHASLFSLFNS